MLYHAKLGNETIVEDYVTSHKLKNITKALHSHHLIKTNYDDSECNNGADAMLLCWQHYGFIGQDVDYEVSPMTQIIEYNRIDTKVLEDIHSLF